MASTLAVMLLALSAVFTSNGVTLRGDFTPATGPGPHPAIVLLPGSGRLPRSEIIMGTLTKRFTADGYDVLVYDKRGVGESGGVFDENEPLETLAGDAIEAIHFLQRQKDVDPHRVGIWGISQGGWLGPLAASMSPDVAFVISVSGPGVSIADQSIYYRATHMLQKGFTLADAQRMSDFRRVTWAYYGTGIGREAALAALDIVKDDAWFKAEGLSPVLATPETLDPALRKFLQEAATYDPLAVARRVRVPVLTIFGAKDGIVPAAQSLANLIDAYKAGANARAQFALFPNAGHGLQRVPEALECHECSERKMQESGVWDAAPGFFDLMDRWLKTLWE